MTAGLLLPLLAASALFDVRAIPLADAAATVFIAPADADKTADVFVLEGNTLTAYAAASERPSKAVLPDETSGFDVYDVDSDGFAEVVAVRGDAILKLELTAAGSAVAETLFILRTQLSAAAPRPYPYVMVAPHMDPFSDGAQPVLALPCEETFELRALDGALVASFPTGADAPHRISYGSPFSVEWSAAPQLGPVGSIEAEVSRVIAFEPELPPDLAPTMASSIVYRRGESQAPRRAGENPQTWPWFPLKTDGTNSLRALYALAEPDYQDSVVCVRQSGSEGVDLSGASVVVGPERRYPGMLCLNGEDLPDFNGDGYVDLLLWQPPPIATSLDALARLLLGWPLRFIITAQLFNPQKNRFDPRPAAQLELDAPPESFGPGGSTAPFRHLVLADFDGDGRTDLGCSTAPNRWAAYLFTDEGLLSRPNFVQDFDAPIERVEFRASLGGGPATAVALRTQSALCVLTPSKK